jgi:hypothetical protein
VAVGGRVVLMGLVKAESPLFCGLFFIFHSLWDVLVDETITVKGCLIDSGYFL